MTRARDSFYLVSSEGLPRLWARAIFRTKRAILSGFQRRVSPDTLEYFDRISLDDDPTASALTIRETLAMPPYALSRRILNRNANSLFATSRRHKFEAYLLLAQQETYLGGNHLLLNLLALSTAPIHARARRRAFARLEAELRDQLRDGWHLEDSFAYQVELIYYIRCASRSPHAEGALGDVLDKTYDSMVGAVRELSSRIGGAHPCWNDAIRPRTLAQEQLLSSILGDGEYDGRVGNSWSRGTAEEIAVRYDRFRVWFHAGSLDVVFDVTDHWGLQGLGHAHDDALGIWVYWNGEAVISELGTTDYYRDVLSRSLERSAAAHSTVRCRIHSAWRQWSWFRYGPPPRVWIESFSSWTRGERRGFTVSAALRPRSRRCVGVRRTVKIEAGPNFVELRLEDGLAAGAPQNACQPQSYYFTPGEWTSQVDISGTRVIGPSLICGESGKMVDGIRTVVSGRARSTTRLESV